MKVDRAADIETIPRTIQHYEISQARVFAADVADLAHWPNRTQPLGEPWPTGWVLHWEENPQDARATTDLITGGRVRLAPSITVESVKKLPLGIPMMVGIEGDWYGTPIRFFLHHFELDSNPTIEKRRSNIFEGRLFPWILYTVQYEAAGLKLEDTDPYARMTWMILNSGAA